MDVGRWLRNLGLEQYEAAFRENDVGAELLPNLTADDLKDLGITSVGHRRQLLQAIATLRPEATPVGDQVRSSSYPPTSATDRLISPDTIAERRPLSVMFCDLIGSTALSSRFDPEDLREIIRAYQACVADAIRRFDGFIARYVGDGVLIYFGWPEAGETDAERAVRAGLAVGAAVSTLPVSGERLKVRVGIATGLVVIGEPIGSGDSRQQTAVGETPNLAARLQGLAGPNQVVIDSATRRQIGGLFACQDLGAVELKGLPAAVPSWLVLSENRAVGQFEALRSGATQLVGRDEEMDLLLRRWVQAKAGSGRVVLMSAEPGVGKSRLAEALAERIATERHVRLRYFCSPHHQDSALYPVIAQMERAAGFAPGEEPPNKVAKLQALLAASAPPIEDVALIAEMHSLPLPDFAPPLDLTPQRKKEKTFEALLRQVEGLAKQQPVLMIFDDLHWIDPSFRELLDRLIDRIVEWPVLLLAMFRPEFQPPWAGQPHVTLLTLPRLDRRDTAAMIANVAGDAALSPEIMEEIAERTDGVPLFVEELTKAVLESGAQAPAALSSIPHPGLSVPATLHASLIARLDRLGPAAKDVAQTGAAIGREFGYGLLASVTDLSEPQLREALDRLTNSSLLFFHGTPPDSSYIFKHALVQDAAYGTLLRSRRRRLHARITATLEDRFPDIVLAQPALLAQHCSAAGRTEAAVAYWLKAGHQAMARSAMIEAVSHLRQGLNLLSAKPDSPKSQQQELDLQIALGRALIASRGYTDTLVGETYARARHLCEELGQNEQLLLVIFGEWLYYVLRGELESSLEMGRELLRAAQNQGDASFQYLGHSVCLRSFFVLGAFTEARSHGEEALGLYNPTYRERLASLTAEDPQCATLAFSALVLFCLGYFDQASTHLKDAITTARSGGEAPVIAYTHGIACFCEASIHDPETLSEHAEAALALSTKYELPFWETWGLFFRGCSFAQAGRPEEGIGLMKKSSVAIDAMGMVCYRPLRLILLAEACCAAGLPNEGLQQLGEATDLLAITQERWLEAEAHRLHGELLREVGNDAAAQKSFERGLAVADRQGTKLWELRTALSLARLWRDHGKLTEARDLLGPAYNWFTEGFDSPDLKDAKALLDELAAN